MDSYVTVVKLPSRQSVLNSPIPHAVRKDTITFLRTQLCAVYTLVLGEMSHIKCNAAYDVNLLFVRVTHCLLVNFIKVTDT